MICVLPRFLRDLINTPPRAGHGVHGWLFRVARQLHRHLPAGEIVDLLATLVVTCGRHVPRHEIISAVQNSLQCAWQPRSLALLIQPVSKWPAVNQEQRKAIIRDGGRLADLWELSPVRIEDQRGSTIEVVDRLFPGNPLLCCGWSQSQFDTKPREDWRGELGKLQFIVPSPMSSATGTTKDGRTSKHCLENTGPRRFLVTEFDCGTIDDQAALLLHLAQFAPMVCALHSGGKSLHGWFFVEAQPHDRVERFFRYAVHLGADPATWTPSQFVRMPDGMREGGRRQTVYFLNYRPLEVKR